MAVKKKELKTVNRWVTEEESVDTRSRVVALEDVQKSAADFLFFRTIRCSLNEFLEQYDFKVARHK